ncbi:MAG: DoxX family protein [bacterium]
MSTRITSTFAPYALSVLRVLVGVTFVAHGYPKLASLQGFAGFLGSLGVPLPQVAAIIVTVLEVVGGLALIVGLGTRWAAVALAIEMLVTTLVVKLPNLGFVAAPDRPGAGAELDLLLMAACLVLWTAGGGALSADRSLLKRHDG